MTPDKEPGARVRFYLEWVQTEEAKELRAPARYSWLLTHPNNFKRVRAAFNLAWITYKLTEL